MIIDVTQQFKSKFLQFRQTAIQNQSQNSKLSTGSQNKNKLSQPSFKKKIPTNYQTLYNLSQHAYLSLKSIDRILKENKQNYFSNAAYSLSAFTNQQRNQFDEETKSSFKQSLQWINSLDKESKQLISVNPGTYAYNFKGLVSCLIFYFKELQIQFGEFLKYNEFKRQKILSTLSLQTQKVPLKELKYFEKRTQKTGQIQQIGSNRNAELQKEAHLFYLQKIEDQKKAIQTKQTIQTINSMLEQMGKKVFDQEILTSSFEQIGSIGLSFIDQGNKNLLEANNLSKSSGKYWVMLFLSLAFSLLVIDFLKS